MCGEDLRWGWRGVDARTLTNKTIARRIGRRDFVQEGVTIVQTCAGLLLLVNICAAVCGIDRIFTAGSPPVHRASSNGLDYRAWSRQKHATPPYPVSSG